MEAKFIPAHGGYKNLLAYRKALIVFDATAEFCRRFLRKGDRTIDQMRQAARSGKQNIVEGTMTSGTSKEAEIKLINVARSSLEDCWKITKIMCASKVAAFGIRTAGKHCTFAS